MAKSVISRKRSNRPRSFDPLQPLECRHYKDHSEIVAYVEPGSEWRVVAEFTAVIGINPEAMAKYVCQLINDNLNHIDILQDAKDALELCLEEAVMTFSSEQAADCIAERIRRQTIAFYM